MEIRFTEDYGNFKWASPSDYSTKWYVAIYHDNQVIKVGDTPCILHWEDEGDCRGQYAIADGIQHLTNEAWKYAIKTWSTEDYKAQTKAFIKVFNDNFTELVHNYEVKRKKDVEEKIKRLQRDLESSELKPEPIDVKSIVESEIKRLETWKQSSLKKLEEYKEGGELHRKEVEQIQKYQTQIDELVGLTTE